jgi:hypothetical protein
MNSSRQDEDFKDDIHIDDLRSHDYFRRRYETSYQISLAIDDCCEYLFHIKRRKTTIYKEIYCGVIQFLSSLYLIIALPMQMKNAGYDLKLTTNIIVSIS